MKTIKQIHEEEQLEAACFEAAQRVVERRKVLHEEAHAIFIKQMATLDADHQKFQKRLKQDSRIVMVLMIVLVCLTLIGPVVIFFWRLR